MTLKTGVNAKNSRGRKIKKEQNSLRTIKTAR